MSSWTYINGIVTVVPPGSGQRAMDFVLGEVVDHLPRVTGSEGDMHVEIVRRPGHDCSSNHDEFGMFSNLSSNPYGRWFEEQSEYDLLLSANLRDRVKSETMREFSKWMCRLASRVDVRDVLVRVSDCYGWAHVFDGADAWHGMQRKWSWVSRTNDGFELSPAYSERRSSNWRYDIMPKDGCAWTEYLVNLVPGGNIATRELDFMAGNLEWFEYGQTADEVDDSIRKLKHMAEVVESTLGNLGVLREDLEKNPIE